ncbi:unnamed protein product, partial [Discosporangium mesarthrocarpum]
EEEEEEEAGSDYDDESDGGRGGRTKKRARAPPQGKKKKPRRDYSRFVDDMAEVDDDDEEDYDEKDRAEALEMSAIESRTAHERVKQRQERDAAFMDKTLEEVTQNILRRHTGRGGVRPMERGMGIGRPEVGMGGARGRGKEARDRGGGGAGSGAGPRVSIAPSAEEGGDDLGEEGSHHGFTDDEDLEGSRGMDPEVAQQALLPSIRDNSLFVVECKAGKERMLCHMLMNKAMFFREEGKEFGLCSAIAPAGSKGFLYLEAANEPLVRAAINGLRGIYHSKLKKVPIPDMTAVLSVRAETRSKPVTENQFVRLRRMPYKDDLAKVVEVHAGGERAVVQFIPRIDLAALSADPDTAAARKRIRPPQRFFNAEEIKIANGEVERRRFQGREDYMDFFNGNFHLNGFVMKEVQVATWLRTDKVNPTLEELQKFKSRKEHKDRMGLSDDSDEERNREEE